MIPLELELIEPLGRLTAQPWASEVTGVQIDSRRIEEGDLFVAASEAGADFVQHALARGAAAALVPEHPHAALATIAGEVRDRSTARVVGITGATGKTTTKDILAALCSRHAAHGRLGGELQQRARRAAHALPARARHRGLHRRDGHARPRPDRVARVVHAARRRR